MIARTKPLHSKNNTAAHLKFAQDHMGKLEAYRKNILCTDESEIELCEKPNTVFQH